MFIVNDTIGGFPEELGDFDVVVMVGVLEYARLYGSSSNPALDLLKKARTHLKPSGTLILAIENKFGLKYFAGVCEDHLGVPWAGITDAYLPHGVATYSRKELLQLMTDAGFKRCWQYYPFPDYKLPRAIVTERGLATPGFSAEAFFQVARPFEDTPLFNLEATYKSVIKGGLLPDLVDSFCFLASPDEERKAPVPDHILAFYYGAPYNSPAQYAKELIMKKRADGLVVERTHLGKRDEANALISQKVKASEAYLHGECLVDRIRKAALLPGWTIKDMASAFAPWVDFLKRNCDEHGRLPGNFLDATPYNIMMENETCTLFDDEWVCREPVSMQTVLVRGICYSLLRLGTLAPPAPGVNGRIDHMLKGILDHFKHALTEEELKSEVEEGFILDAHVGFAPKWEELARCSLFFSPSRTSHVFDSRNEIRALQAQIDSMKSSRSWRYMEPLRRLKKYVTGLKRS